MWAFRLAFAISGLSRAVYLKKNQKQQPNKKNPKTKKREVSAESLSALFITLPAFFMKAINTLCVILSPHFHKISDYSYFCLHLCDTNSLHLISHRSAFFIFPHVVLYSVLGEQVEYREKIFLKTLLFIWQIVYVVKSLVPWCTLSVSPVVSVDLSTGYWGEKSISKLIGKCVRKPQKCIEVSRVTCVIWNNSVRAFLFKKLSLTWRDGACRNPIAEMLSPSLFCLGSLHLALSFSNTGNFSSGCLVARCSGGS